MFRNLTVQSPAADQYIQMVQDFALPRKESKHWDTTSNHGNKSMDITLYDKDAEKRAKGFQVPVSSTKTLRLEVRLKSSKKVTASTGITTVADLIDRYHELGQVFVDQVRKNYFNADPSKLLSGRKYPAGAVAKTLNTIYKTLQCLPCATEWWRGRLDEALEQFRFDGFAATMKELFKSHPDLMRRLWQQLTALRRAILTDALRDPEYRQRYMTLRQWLVGSGQPSTVRRQRAQVACAT